MPSFMPPNGFAGLAQMTPAGRDAAGVGGKNPRHRPERRRRRATKAAAAPSRRRRRSKKAARLVKGSAAAKRYMAKIRRMRRR